MPLAWGSPVVSWGVLLRDRMSMRGVAQTPWLLLPVVFIIVTVLSFNFLPEFNIAESDSPSPLQTLG